MIGFVTSATSVALSFLAKSEGVSVLSSSRIFVAHVSSSKQKEGEIVKMPLLFGVVETDT